MSQPCGSSLCFGNSWMKGSPLCRDLLAVIPGTTVCHRTLSRISVARFGEEEVRASRVLVGGMYHTIHKVVHTYSSRTHNCYSIALVRTAFSKIAAETAAAGRGRSSTGGAAAAVVARRTANDDLKHGCCVLCCL